MSSKRSVRLMLWALVVFAIAGSAVAQGGRYDDWFVGSLDDGSGGFAGTSNDSGSILANYCYFDGRSCEYRIGFSTRCDVGDSYPGLINSDVGGAHITIRCGGSTQEGRWIYVVNEYDTVDQIVKQGMRIGIAVPLQRDEFHVLRFSLRGATAATTFMRGAVSNARSQGRNGVRGTRDTRL